MEYNQTYDDTMEEDTLKNKYLFFSIDNEVYAIELNYVIAIIGMPSITPVPHMPNFIKGIINMRGNVIPVMDLRIRFDKEIMGYTARTPIIIINYGEATLGLIVDTAIEVGLIMPDEILPATELENHNIFIRGVSKLGDESRFLINCEKLIDGEELVEINKAL